MSTAAIDAISEDQNAPSFRFAAIVSHVVTARRYNYAKTCENESGNPWESVRPTFHSSPIEQARSSPRIAQRAAAIRARFEDRDVSDARAKAARRGHAHPPRLRPRHREDHQRSRLRARYAGKTQVFSFVENDDICRRGLHVQLVPRRARHRKPARPQRAADRGHSARARRRAHAFRACRRAFPRQDLPHERTAGTSTQRPSVRVLDELYAGTSATDA